MSINEGDDLLIAQKKDLLELAREIIKVSQ